jgi:hypothetical protein
MTKNTASDAYVGKTDFQDSPFFRLKIGSGPVKGLAKVSSSINLGNSSGLASLGRASISGQPSGAPGVNLLQLFLLSLPAIS